MTTILGNIPEYLDDRPEFDVILSDSLEFISSYSQASNASLVSAWYDEST